MRNFFGFLLLFAGLSLGVLAYQPEAIERHSRLAEVTWILAPAGRMAEQTEAVSAVDENQRSFSPKSPLFALAEAPQWSASEQTQTRNRSDNDISGIETASIAQQTSNATGLPPVVYNSQSHRKAAGWQAVVTFNPAIPTASNNWASPKPKNDYNRYALIRSIQRELRRVGCYGGKIDGSWGQLSKYAMEAFTKQVNAVLPMKEPDYILLSLVKAHRGTVCGRSCPDDHVMSTRGICLPRTVIAKRKLHSERRLARAASSNSKSYTPKLVKRPQLVSSRRIALANAGPAGRIGNKNGRQQTRALSRVAVAADPVQRPISHGHTRKPLPGRMSVGGPSAEPPPSASAALEGSGDELIGAAVPSALEAELVRENKAEAQRARRAAKKKAKRATRIARKAKRKKRRRKWKRHKLPKEHRAILSDAFFD